MKVTIGLETHVQLNTKSKIFCGCRNPVNLQEEPEPNTLTCETCLGMPGSKPRTNEAVVEMGLKVASALECSIAKDMFFSRKTYFYPDMSKNFQITQYEIPLASGGRLAIELNGNRKEIRLRRVHMEEDPSKLVHVGGMNGRHVLADYNRAGIPLLEIVTDPDFDSPEEARAFLQKLATILEYLGVYSSSSRAVFKSDANISLNGGERVEIKNITGTKEIEMALKFEVLRQKTMIEQGQKIKQSTRMWNPDTKTTHEMRTKETEEDYGYIFEPDLTRIRVEDAQIRKAKDSLPELPDQKLKRFVKQYKMTEALSESLVSELEVADLFEEIAGKISPSLAASWVAGYLKKTLNYNGVTFSQSGVEKKWIITLLEMFEKGEITDRNAEMAIRKMVEDKKGPQEIIKKYSLGKTSDSGEVEKAVSLVLEKNKKAVEDYKKGEEKSLHFLVGQAMKETRGQVDANDLKKLIVRLIGK